MATLEPKTAGGKEGDLGKATRRSVEQAEGDQSEEEGRIENSCRQSHQISNPCLIKRSSTSGSTKPSGTYEGSSTETALVGSADEV